MFLEVLQQVFHIKKEENLGLRKLCIWANCYLKKLSCKFQKKVFDISFANVECLCQLYSSYNTLLECKSSVPN
jgi:hypothetical protein